MAKCKDCTHYLTCIKGNSNPEYCGQFMNYKNTVEVVRCKDCEYYEIGKDYLPYCNHCDGGIADYPREDDFCSYGERKTDG